MSLETRINALEENQVVDQLPDPALTERWLSVVDVLLETMSDDHAEKVLSEMGADVQSTLANAAYAAAARRMRFGDSRPYAMPPEVCDVLLRNPEALAIAECSNCKLELPVTPKRGDDGKPIFHFLNCPLCGADIHKWAWNLERDQLIYSDALGWR